jgi:methionine-rich copper-binding protein CopC
MRLPLILATAAAVAITSVSTTATASAVRRHIRLLKSAPAAHDTLADAPAAIRLWFSEKVELKVTTVKLVHADGTPIRLARPELNSAKDTAAIAVTITHPLAPGGYTVGWSAASDDGHPAKGTIDFFVKGGR